MAAALVGGAFLSASLQVLLDRIASREVLDFFQGKENAKKLLNKLETTFLALTAIVDDAENNQITNPQSPIKKWLEKLKDTIYRTEDLLDEITTQALRSKWEAEEQGSAIKVSNPIVNNRSFEWRMKEMIDCLKEFLSQKDFLGLKENAGSGSKWFHRSQTTSLMSEDDVVYGRDGNREQIIELLLSDDGRSKKVSVIPIVGMGGVGKTTLAQLVFNDDRVQKNFEKKAWVCVSDEYDVFRVTETLLSKVGSLDSNTIDLDKLQVKLSDSLKATKFLVVLDDVWNKRHTDWELLSLPFKSGAEGSKIIVTTRDERVASIMCTVPSIHLGGLSDEGCWSLFEKYAFENCDDRRDSRLEEIGKKIVKKCNGLPLAVKTLGGLLRCQLGVKEWSYILNSNMWDWQDDTILPALRLSYHYLPPHLKRCFAYCSIFPKGFAIDPEMVVWLWMAEDLVPQPEGNRTILETAQDCLHELISRSLLQERRGDIVMHDLVNDLARHVSGEFSCSPENDKQEGVLEKVRYFSYHPKDGRDDIFKRIKGESLRTFFKLSLYFSSRIDLTKEVLQDILGRQKFLRVLWLPYYTSSELPNSLGHLLHLRCLNLSWSKIKCLPNSLTDLFNLQTLNLYHCRELTELPADMRKLINLCYLDIRKTPLEEMPAQMGRLKSLQFLPYFKVAQKRGTQIEELSDLNHLQRSLYILRLENVRGGEDASKANLEGKEHLEKLKLEWTGDASDSQTVRDVLDNLRPHTNIKHLIIKGYGSTRFPDWLGRHSFRNMVSLRLKNCKYCVRLPPLGQLPSLEELVITGMDGVAIIGQEFYGNGLSVEPFKSLRRLTIEDMAEWEELGLLWAKEFSHLEKLRLKNCPKLKGAKQLVGSFNGQMTAMSSLKILELIGLPNLEKPLLELGKLTSLENLFIYNCMPLSCFAEDSLPETLESLWIENCEVLKSLPEVRSSDCSSHLVFTRTLITDLPTGVKKLIISWEKLNLRDKLNLLLYSADIGCHRTSLQTSEFYNSCDFINSIPRGFFTGLRSLHIEGMQDLEIFLILQRHQNLESLRTLNIKECPNLVLLPEQMSILLPSLEELIIWWCPKIESFPKGGLPSTLRRLVILNCNKLMANRVSWGQQRLPFLKELEIGYVSKWAPLAAEPQPEWMLEEWMLPFTLTDLCITGLTNMESLNGKALQHLTSLTTLRLLGCRKLEALPKEGLPASLHEVSLWDCPLLVERGRCEEERGEDCSAPSYSVSYPSTPPYYTPYRTPYSTPYTPYRTFSDQSFCCIL